MDLPKEATDETGIMGGGGGGKKKKQKKSKPNKTQSLNAFLADSSAGKHIKDPPKRTDSWADAMEERLDAEGEVSTTWQGGGSNTNVDLSQLPSAPRKAQARNIDRSRLPKAPPYTVYLGNLSYECSEEDIVYFFERKNLKVKEVRLPTDSGTSRLKGFGYAELDSVSSLLEALELTGENLRNRAVTIDLATSKSSDGYSDGMRGDRYRRDSNDDRTETDWRRGSGDDRFSPQREYHNGPPGYYGDRPSYRGGTRGGGYDDGRRGRERGGGWNERPEYRDNRGYGDSRYGDSRYGDGGGYGGRRHDDYYDRRGPPRYHDDGGYNRGPPQREERPRLQLQPRTKPVETSSNDGRSSIFGSAQPVDTATREREIENKLRKEQERAALEEERAQKEREAREEREKVSVFGGARPVDTASREKEIEEKLRKQNEEIAERTKRQRKGSDEGRIRRGSDRVRKGSDRGWPSDDGGRYSQSPDGRRKHDDETNDEHRKPLEDRDRPNTDHTTIDRSRPIDNHEPEQRSHDSSNRGRRRGGSSSDGGRRTHNPRNRIDSNDSESGREWRGGRRGRGGNRSSRGENKRKGSDSGWSKGKSRDEGPIKKYEEPSQPTFSQPSRYAMLDVEGDDSSSAVVVSGEDTSQLTKSADD